jgi:hypothetical protein
MLMKFIEYSVWHPDGNIDYVADEVSANELAQQVGGFVIPIVETEEIKTLVDEAGNLEFIEDEDDE